MPPPAAVGQGLGVREAFLDATGTKAQWLSTLALERTEAGMTCYTFDLDGVIDALIGVKLRDPGQPARVRIIADDVHTHGSKEAGQLFARAQGRGVEVRVGRGPALRTGCVKARPDNPMLDKEGGHHAKVLFGVSTQTAVIGSCNFTTSSQCNVELSAKVSLSPSGTDQILAWFDRLWNDAVPHVIGGGSAASSGRSPTRNRSRGPGAQLGGRAIPAPWIPPPQHR